MTELNDTTPAPEVDDFDVEGHGLREVAIGVSAATLLATGSAATLAHADSDPFKRTLKAAGGLVTAVQQDVRQLSDDALATAGEAARTAGSEVGKARVTASDAARDAVVTVGQTGDAARQIADSAVTQVGDTTRPVLTDPVRWSDGVVDRTVAETRATRDQAVRLTISTAETAQKTVAEVPETLETTATNAASTVAETADLSVEAQTEDGASASVGAAGHRATVTVD